ncbi:uncharacterized protein DNG_09164 [Cephalotrichum gorgonifer]|uniref:Uncharacterized protein n=1 Tax=Cephalotrichum gorgonifer TaxID=2041049 RepID=A0AAE8N6D7_9PEZI|nr:uncharacterized protein DNG_09164 [Cephalotrichum gorgonifer]
MVEDKGPMIILVCWIFTGFSLLFVGARLFVRSAVHRQFFSDDYLIILSMICALISNVFVTLSVSHGNGKHFDVLDLDQKQNTIKWMMAAYVPGIETLGLPKLAVIALLTRLLAPGTFHFWLLWAMGVIVCLSLTAMVLALILQCTPVEALWTFSLGHDCLNPDILVGLAFWASTSSAFLDFYLAVYPAIVLWGLQMPLKKKLVLSGVLGVGFVSGCVGIVKATGVPTLRSMDVSYDLSDPLYWTSIEGNLIIIAACIPILQPLVEMARGRKLWTSKKSSGSGGRPYQEFSKPSANRPDDMELQSRPKKKYDEHGFTVRDGNGSEESIVKRDLESNSETSGRRSGSYHSPNGGIMKTNAVTVTYDAGSEGPTSSAKRWAAPLRQLHPDPNSTAASPAAKVDIIAVHGLNPRGKSDPDHAWDTWRTPSGPNGRLWLRDDLPQHFPESRIFLYQYNATAQALINAHNNRKYTRIKDATTGLAFFATPHNGSDHALVSLGSTAATIASTLGFQKGDDVIETLKSGSIFSDIMQNHWRQQLLQYDIVSFWGALDDYVPRESARFGLPGDHENIVKLDADHRGVCKFGPSEEDQDNFELVLGNVQDLYEGALTRDMCAQDFSPEQIRQKNEWLRKLNTCQYLDCKNRNPQRARGTCEWFTNHPRFKNWQQTKLASLLWVSADPGCGKSVLSRYLADEILPSTATRTTCYFFFKDDFENQRHSTTALCCILRQIFIQNPAAFSTQILERFEQDGEKMLRSFHGLWGMLISVATSHRGGEIVCIFDALDECEASGQRLLIEAVNKFYSGAAARTSALKFLLTSRAYGNIQRGFWDLEHNLPTIHLKGENDEERAMISDEINIVIRSKIARIPRLGQKERTVLGEELTRVPNRGFMPLHFASDFGLTIVVQQLLYAGADASARDDRGCTPLHYASRDDHVAVYGHDGIVQQLLDAGADVSAKEDDGSTPLHYASRHGHEAVVQQLLDAGADEDDGSTPLHYASQDGYETVVQQLLDAGADVSAKEAYDGRTPLHYASRHGHDGIVKQLLNTSADGSVKDDLGLAWQNSSG